MRSETVIGKSENARPRARRRLPFFREHWNETYGWHAAAYIAAPLARGVAFAAIAEAVSDGDLITTWDARLNSWLGENSSPALTRAFELYTHIGSALWLTCLAIAAVAALAWRGVRADAVLVALATSGALIINPLFKEF